MKSTLITRFSPIIFLVILILLSNPIKNASALQSIVNIEISNNVVFKIENLAPGDWMQKELMVMNQGNQDFRYIAKLGETNSYKGLFEELELLVKKDSFLLFEGKLKDFKGLNPRVLSKGSQERLLLQVKMPYELGNEFQGSAAEAEIIFYAEGITDTSPSCEEDPSQVGCEQPPGGTPSDPNPEVPDVKDVVVIPKDVNRLPNTATNNYNILLVGVVLLGGGSVLLLINRRRKRRNN
ncbi:LPXTG cell wall anchor domain-containing protein [Mesobacillus subterraneus]|uniref:LPXTG cell wall anchor domain-containing protein n=1 Tax=Mesobacillus subterraneus TaxID=285983 RepID=A0A3R9EZL9_9BACI|nr:LPXTG cell wall anchor domain-containing protein [Mesobacillus subterraneus]RSD26758.1 LPXTG cell wall anchor domain-containing protein [Mesobacillus subterraneus]